MKSARESVEHVRVCCRVRPLNAAEKQMHKELCVDYPSHTSDAIECRIPTVTPNVMDSTVALGDASHSAITAVERHAFTFSRVFRPEAGQADVYEHVARPIVIDVMSGYNGTVFMYGQTGSGKTHTMFGDVKGGAWAVKNEESSSPRPSTTLPLENQIGMKEESGDEDAKASDSVSEEDDEESGAKYNEEVSKPVVTAAAVTVPPPSANSSSFCRTRATVTPLGEVRQVNTLQTVAGMADYQQKNGDSAKKKPVRTKMSKAHEKRHRSAFSNDSISGVIPRAVHDIFQAIADADPSTEFDVQIFFVEVYMEQIRDLLVPAFTTATNAGNNTHSTLLSGHRPAHKLQLREDVSTHSFYIDGCRMPHVSSASEVLQLVKTGLKHRATSATSMNETSSRSHCLLNLTVKSVNHAQCVSTVGKLYLVDLAGSEKVGKTNASGLRLEEAKLINKSLSTLGMVIMSLTDQSATHTPYRDSVLTKILKDSLGGNSHTALVICCSPSPYNAQETLSTLRFGARAKAIENKAVVNRELTAAQLKRMLDSAKEEIERLHSIIRQLKTVNKTSNNSAMLYDSFAMLTSLTDKNGQAIGSGGDFPAATRRRLSSASVSSSVALSGCTQDSNRISTLLEERASEQARLQQLLAEVAQLQDNLKAAQETIATLQEERDGYFDKIQNYEEEMAVWEAAHHDALHRAATQDALLRQCKVLLRTQSSEIKDLTKAMQDYAIPLAQAKAAVEELKMSVFGPDATSECRHLLPVNTLTHAATAAALSEPPAARLSGLSHILEGESPNPRRQLVAEIADDSIVLPRTSRSQQQQGPHMTEGRLAGMSDGLSPAVVAVQEWRSRHPSAEPERVDNTDRLPTRSLSSLAHTQCIRRLEEQLETLAKEHAALQERHKDTLAELQSKQRILELRRGHLENVKEQLKNEYSLNKELQERLEKEKEMVRAPLEMARNDANYWRRRFEELASRRSGPPSCSLENPRGSLRFAFSQPGDGSCESSFRPLPFQPRSSSHNAGGAAEIRSSILGSAFTSKARLSISGTPSRPTSCRGSGEEVLLSLSSHSTPVRTHVSFSEAAPQQLISSRSVTNGAKTITMNMEEEQAPSSSPRRCGASRSVSPRPNSKL